MQVSGEAMANLIFKLLLVIALFNLCALEGYALSKGPDLDHIVKMAQMQQSKLTSEIKGAVFVAEAIYIEKERDGDVKKEIAVRRRVHVHRQGEIEEEYLSLKINGKELQGEEREKAINEWKKGSKNSKVRMPFSVEGQGMYTYELIGSETLNGVSTWVIGFNAKQKREGLVNGRAYVSKDKYNIVHMDFTPSNIPSVIKDIKLSLDYSNIHGYWIPTKFEMNMEVEVKFVLSLFHRNIKIIDVYSQHKLNI